MPRTRSRHLGRTWAGWLVAPVALLGLGVTSAPAPPVQIHVVVDGTPVVIGQPATVGRALRAAGVRPRDGHLHTAVSGSTLAAAVDPAVLTRNGAPADLDTRVHEGDVVGSRDGRDWVEATVARTEAVPATGLPAIETFAWRPGAAGSRRVVVGARSGEAVRATVIDAPRLPARIPGRVVTLSFDDGPHDEWTPQILDILRRRKVRAVFCVVGEMVDAHPEIVRRIAAEGHRLCDHSVDHADLEGAPPEQLDAEIGPTADRVAAITGERPALFRAPYGSFTDAVVERAHAAGLRALGWSVDTDDYERPAPTELVPALVDAVEPGAVVLFHDGGGDRQSTVDALPYVITALRRAGYRFVLPGVGAGAGDG
ncbi:MAG: polysaccharide deacetylase family protein [Acidimicrobiales bacterium]|nr:polysaccharide deacetylase family protein [Acidimicrobiales bacterium]